MGDQLAPEYACFHYVDSEHEKARAVYRLSYLAKARGKGYRPAQAKDYGASRIRMALPAKAG